MGVVNMKMYERYEAFWGAAGGFEKIFQNDQSGRLFLLHFASYTSYIWICEVSGQFFGGFKPYFMNFMKMYEGGVLKGFFAFASLLPADFMKLEKWLSSYKFINGGV